MPWITYTEEPGQCWVCVCGTGDQLSTDYPSLFAQPRWQAIYKYKATMLWLWSSLCLACFLSSRGEYLNPWSAGPVYLSGSNLVITVTADGLAPLGARPTAGTVLTKLAMLFFKFLCLSMISNTFSLMNGCQQKINCSTYRVNLCTCISLYSKKV